MTRNLLALFCLLLLAACPPVRGVDGDDDDDDAGGGSEFDGVWLVHTTESNGETSVSHSFSQWNRGAGLCGSVRDYYEGYASGYATYSDEYAAFEQEFGDNTDTGDLEYRQRYCEVTLLYYEVVYFVGGPLFEAGTEIVSLNVGEGEPPVADTYEAVDQDNPPDELPDSLFDGSRTTYLITSVNPYAGFDCTAWANSGEVEMYVAVDEDMEPMALEALVAGTLEVVDAGDSSWDLSLSGGLLRDFETEAEQTFELSASTFSRCDIEVSFPASR